MKSRRQFLKNSAAVAAPMIVPASVLGGDGKVAPSERITLACIGVGGQGSHNLRAFLGDERVQVLAICDVDDQHRANALAAAKLDVNAGTRDFREIVSRTDIDAVMIATPDHWHSLITAAAARAGKDVFCEKPLAASIGEGRFVSDLITKEKRVLQCGTWRRSGQHVRMACEWVRNGYIGDIKEVEIGVPAKFQVQGDYTGTEPTEPVPAFLDYAMWQGPKREAPYTRARCHFNFRWVLDYAPGYITDWGAHFIDVAQWGLGTDDTTPVSIRASEVTRRDKGIYNAPEGFRIEYGYASGVKMTMITTADPAKWGTKFIGSKGWIFTENDKLETSPESLRTTKLKDGEIKLYVSKNHHRNFIDCVKSREATAAPVEAAHRAASCCHLGAIAAAIGGELKFDPKAERFTNSEEANKFLMPEMRAPWKLS